MIKSILLCVFSFFLVLAADDEDLTVRFATFNASLNRGSAGELLADFNTTDVSQIQSVSEIIQRVRPDVLLINEFDYDETEMVVQLFLENYLKISQANDTDPIDYPYYYVAPSNTGIPSGVDFDNNNSTSDPNDAFGFGFFPGQFGMLVLSMYPVDVDSVRTFQKFLWKDMPDALLPINPDTNTSYYSEEALEVFRLSSKSHWDVPILVDDTTTIHFLVSHPTPPVFDGPEDRNGRRNHDERRE